MDRSIRSKGGSVKSGSIKALDKGPSVMPVRQEPVEYMPKGIVLHYQGIVDDMVENTGKYTESDQSEHWERLGVSQLYYGTYRQATISLQNAYELRKKVKYTRASARIALMLGICHYRVGLIDSALTTLETVVKNALKSYPDLACIAYGNIGMLFSAQGKMKESVENAKKGLELSLKIAKGDKAAERVLQVARILISIYLKINDFQKAEILCATFTFPKHELVLLKAGIKFASGNIEDSADIMEIYLEEYAKEEREIEEDAKTHAKNDGDDDGLSVASVLTQDEDKHVGDDDHSVHSYHSGLITEHTEDSGEENETVITIDNRTQKEKWADEDKKAIIAKAQAKSLQDEHKYSIYSKQRKLLDRKLVEAKLIYNLSVLANRHRTLQKAVHKLDEAANVVDKYLSIQSEHRELASKSDEKGMMQEFYDADLNIIPLCETLDETSEPQIILSHIFYARAETSLVMARKARMSGIAISRGKLINRALNDVDNGSDLDPYDKVRSQAFDEEFEDPAYKEARQYLVKSIEVLQDTNLPRDIVSFDTIREVERDIPVEKHYDEDGNEIPEEPATETITTVLSPHDMNVAAAQKSYADNYLDMTGGQSKYVNVKEKVMKDLKTQYGVKLTERGTKGHQNMRVDYKNVYVSTYHDPLSIRAELMPLVSRSGSDDVSLWVEWCLSSSGGLGMGIFGTSFTMPINKAQLQKEMADKAAAELASVGGGSSIAGTDDGTASLVSAAGKNDNLFKSLDPTFTIGSKTAFPALQNTKPTDAFLKEVRARLTEVEGVLSAKFDQSESLYRPRDKELRILINICLARVTAQLNQKRDCELAVDMIEELAKDLHHRTQNKFDGHYVTLASRWRLELEESKIPSALSSEAHSAKLMELLVYAKEYVNTAERCSNNEVFNLQKNKEFGVDFTTSMLLMRDAYKKCINIFLDLSSIPEPQEGGKGKGGGNKLPRAAPVEKGTLEMLNLYTPDEIEEKEENGDIDWFKKFGKVRAQQLFMKLKALKEKDLQGGKFDLNRLSEAK